MPLDTGSTKKKYPISKKTDETYPELAREVAHMATAENPEGMEDVGNIREMNWFERMLRPGAVATTSPFGNIAINRTKHEGYTGEVPKGETLLKLGDTLAHEMVHTGQRKKEGLVNFMLKGVRARGMEESSKPYEIPAYAAEHERYKKQPRDIQLPNESGKIDVAPRNIPATIPVENKKGKKTQPNLILGTRG